MAGIEKGGLVSESNENYEELKREFAEHINEPSFVRAESNAVKDKKVKKEEFKREERVVKLYFPGGKVVELEQLHQEYDLSQDEKTVASTAWLILQEIIKQGVDPEMIGYTIDKYAGVLDRESDEETLNDVYDIHLDASFPYDDDIRGLLKRVMSEEVFPQ